MAFSPTDISNILCWYKADAGLTTVDNTLVLGSATDVAQWNDQSGNGFNLVQAVVTRQPTLEQNVNGTSPGVYFDTGEKMTNALAAIATAQPVQCTTFAVVKCPTTSATEKYLWHGAVVTNTAVNVSVRKRTNDRMGLHGGNAVFAPIEAASYLGQWRLFCWKGGTASDFYTQINAVTMPPTGNWTWTASGAVAGITVGGRADTTSVLGWQGHINQLIIYARALTDEEVRKVSVYLAGQAVLTLYTPALTSTGQGAGLGVGHMVD